MKIGDLITTYYPGYFRLTSIEKRYVTEDLKRYDIYKENKIGDEISPLYHFVQIYDKDGNPKKSKEKRCDALFCKLAKDSLEEELNRILIKKEKIKI